MRIKRGVEGLTLITSSQPEGGYGANDAKDIVGEGSDDLALRRVGSVKCETRTRRSYNLLLFRTSELPKDSLRDGGGRL